ncbi:MAG: hypothetical protein FJX57_00910 [Alphaproteobacteria bacterium]|nr:hypothetical protein [Alphaproteobacteria bacterium]
MSTLARAFVTTVMLATALPAVAKTVAALPAPATAIARHACGPAVERALVARGIALDRVASLFLVNSIAGGLESSRLEGYDAWVQPLDQRGSIVVRVDTRCGLREVYARDGAMLPR